MSDANARLSRDGGHYPLHMILSIVPSTAVDDILADLQILGILAEQVDVAQGEADAQRIITAGKQARFEHIAEILQFGQDQLQRTEYITALQQGHTVLFTRLASDAQRKAVATALAQRGGHFINYYGRWTIETLHQ